MCDWFYVKKDEFKFNYCLDGSEEIVWERYNFSSSKKFR